MTDEMEIAPVVYHLAHRCVRRSDHKTLTPDVVVDYEAFQSKAEAVDEMYYQALNQYRSHYQESDMCKEDQEQLYRDQKFFMWQWHMLGNYDAWYIVEGTLNSFTDPYDDKTNFEAWF